MTRPSIAPPTAAAVAVTVLALAGGLWWWKPWQADIAVPSCDRLATALSTTEGGSWTVQAAEPNRQTSRVTARCTMTVVSPSSVFTSSISVLMSGQHDTDALRDEVARGACNGALDASPNKDTVLASRQCVEVISGTVRYSALAASETRYVRTVAATTASPHAARSTDSDAVLAHARATAQLVTDVALSLSSNT